MAEVRARDSLQRSVVRVANQASADLTLVQAKVTLQSLDDYYCRYVNAQLAVDEITGRELIDHEQIGFVNTESQYLAAKVTLTEKIDAETRQMVQAANPNQPNLPNLPIPPNVQPPRINTKMKIGAITLPKFNGEYKDWMSFSDLFTSLVHNDTSISSAQKLYLLKAHLTGDAESLIKAFPVTDANYLVAWELIEKRFNNKRVIVDSHLKVLFDQPKLQNENAIGLRNLVDSSREAVRCLEALELPVREWDVILAYILIGKVDLETHRQWELSLKTPSELVKYEDLLKFLDSRWKSLEMIPTASKTKAVQKSSKLSTTQAFIATSDSRASCAKCSENHSLEECRQFKAMESQQRKDYVRTKNLCFRCLRSDHSFAKCTASRCSECRGRHHRLLHHSNPETSPSTPPVSKPEATHTVAASTSSVAEENRSSVNSLLSHGSCQVVLSTAIVLVEDEAGNKQKIRALLDSGSEATFITDECVDRLQLKRSPAYVSISGIGKTDAGCTRGSVTLNLSSCVDPAFHLNVRALILNKLTNLIPREKVTKASWSHLCGITLADADYNVPGRIDMLIGADIYGSILTNGFIPASKSAPVAQNTRFGWILIGLTGSVSSRSLNCNLSTIDDHLTLEKALQKFWEVETMDERKAVYTKEEENCEEHFIKTYSRDVTGRFVVRLPLTCPNALGSSKEIALKRLNSVERRFIGQPALQQQYAEFMNEYANLDHMRPAASLSVSDHQSYYLAHHAVFKASSSTTKVRVVFDASCKTSSGISLNDVQLTGAKLQDNLFDIILRFRRHRIALSADISKMYRQILVHSDDQDYQRILWRKNSSSPVQEWQLQTVTYGMAAAPFLAIRSLRQLAALEADNFPDASKVVLSDFYVDDLITGCDDIGTAITLQHNLNEMLRRGGFELRKWSSNEPDAIRDLPAEYKEAQSPLAISDEQVVGTLGIMWHPCSDNFGFSVRSYTSDGVVSKRRILSEISSLFDPLGWLSPSIIIGKMLMQELWLLGMNWDEEVPDEVAIRWDTYRNGLTDLESIRIPRWLIMSPNQSIQLHGFSDASEKAIAAVVYLRAMSTSGSISSILVTSKTKVAPVKTISVPRLELCAAHLLAKLLMYVKRTLQLPEDIPYAAWTDSTIVLSWLQRRPITLKTFVANRISDIQDRTSPSSWRHVRSNDNPADCASRGVDPSMLSTHELWWNGPPWLIQSEDTWPKTELTFANDSVLELKSSVLTVTVDSQPEWDLLSKFSSYTQLMRITALVRRFVYNCRCRKNSTVRQIGWLTTTDLQHASMFWLKIVQNQAFPAEIRCCRSKIVIPRTSKLLQLNPFLDEDDFLRVGGRLNAADMPYENRKPLILPEKSFFTFLLISDFHLKFLHSGTQLTLTNLRAKYWVIGGRRVISKYIRQCVVCVRQRGATQNQLMGDLPPYRVQQNNAFVCSGVDYAGPFNLRMSKGRGSKTVTKGYIALFVCMATKAIHMELASDLSTDAFLAAFRRFVSRRGPCRELHSDNGTNFVGAKKELVKILKDERLDRSLVNDGTTWSMIPAGSPHQGGLWEAGVKAAKFHLRRVLADTILTYEEFNTVLVQIEACLNSRPICPITDCPSDLNALTPAHLAFGKQLGIVPEVDMTDSSSTPRNRWHLIQRLQQHFWKRWHTEYLTTLQTRPKWKAAMANVKVGDLAIIKDDRLPPTKWSMGRITECHPGRDKLVRVVTLKTNSGSTKRAIQKLCILPVE